MERDVDLTEAQKTSLERAATRSRRMAKPSDAGNELRRMEPVGERVAFGGILGALGRGSSVASADTAGNFYSWAQA